VPLRCYVFKYSVGTVVKWYEEEGGMLWVRYALGEHSDNGWRFRTGNAYEEPKAPAEMDRLEREGRVERLG
jgi:hypothetical protein